MHHHLEIVMPRVENLEQAIEQIMKPFQEGREDDEDSLSQTFWDWYVIGGRFAGCKIKANYPQEQMDKFFAALNEAKVTVSSFTAGKQELSPATQIPMVDQMWRDHFPEGGDVCPIFKHYNDQYKGSDGFPDVMALKDTPSKLLAGRTIFAAPDDDGKMRAVHMVQDDFYNGVNFVKSTWDGTLATALEEFKVKLKNYREDYAQKITPQDDWLCVTVDYHS